MRRWIVTGLLAALLVPLGGVPAQALAGDDLAAFPYFQWDPTGGNEVGTDVAVRPDGVVVVGGLSIVCAFVGSASPAAFGTFEGCRVIDVPGVSTETVDAVAVDGQNRVVVVGTAVGASTMAFVGRLTAAGAPDATFSGDGYLTLPFGGATSSATGVGVDASGGIVIAGTVGSPVQGFAARRLPGGKADAAFGVNGVQRFRFAGGATGGATDLAIGAGGRIVIAGTSSTGSSDFGLVALTAAGAFDTAFSGDGRRTVDVAFGSNDQASAVRIDGQGRIVVAGSSNLGFAVARVRANGTLDTFGFQGKAVIQPGTDAGIGSDLALVGGRILVAGQIQNGSTFEIDPTVVGFTSGGQLDTTWSTDGFANRSLRSPARYLGITRRPGGGVYVVGSGGTVVTTFSDSDMVICALTTA